MINNTSNGLDQLLAQLVQNQSQGQQAGAQPVAKPKPPLPQDTVSLSGQKNNNQNQSSKQSTLVSTKTQETENGFRRTQEFENEQGKKFTRIEEVTTEQNRSKRLVIQQNDSGSATVLENIIDKLEDDTFRLVQRYTDETGETKTNVQLNYIPKDNDIISGRPPPISTESNNPFQNLRGTQVDFRV